jgi:hypothetical protein
VWPGRTKRHALARLVHRDKCRESNTELSHYRIARALMEPPALQPAFGGFEKSSGPLRGRLVSQRGRESRFCDPLSE